jgi:hypothetical protein
MRSQNTYEINTDKNIHHPARLLHSCTSTVYYKDKLTMVQIFKNRNRYHVADITRFLARLKLKFQNYTY